MTKSVRNLIYIIIFFTCFIQAGHCYTLDTSVDTDIRKKYNSTKLSDEVLPELPKKLEANPSSSGSSAAAPTVNPSSNVVSSSGILISGTKIPKGTKFHVKSNVKINDWLKNGSSVSFTSFSPVYNKYSSIPSGAAFKGIITDIHRPQSTGNGGLVEIKIVSLTSGGKTYPVNGVIIKADGKNIFLNNIKGKRGYIKGVKTQYSKGENFYQKSRKTSAKMSSNPVGTVLAPIPTIAGVLGYTVNTVICPISGLTGKGEGVNIPQGSVFVIKLVEDAHL